MSDMFKITKPDEKFDGYRPTAKDLRHTKNRYLLNIGLGIEYIGEDV